MPTREDTELNELLEVYLQELRVRRYSASSVTLAKRVLPRFFAHLSEKGIKDIRAVEEKHVTVFARKLDKAGLALSSQNAYRNTLRGFFSFLERKRRLLTNPAAHLPFYRIPKLPRNVLSVSEVERLMKEPDTETRIGKRNRALLEIFYGTAIRLSECERLDLGDLDLKERLLLIRSGKGKKGPRRTGARSGRDRSRFLLNRSPSPIAPIPKRNGTVSLVHRQTSRRRHDGTLGDNLRQRSRHPSSRYSALSSTCLRDASRSTRSRHPARPGAPRASRYLYYGDLHAGHGRRPEEGHEASPSSGETFE